MCGVIGDTEAILDFRFRSVREIIVLRGVPHFSVGSREYHILEVLMLH